MQTLTGILVIPALIASVALPVFAAPTMRSDEASVKRNSSIAMQNRRLIRIHHPMMHHSMATMKNTSYM